MIACSHGWHDPESSKGVASGLGAYERLATAFAVPQTVPPDRNSLASGFWCATISVKLCRSLVVEETGGSRPAADGTNPEKKHERLAALVVGQEGKKEKRKKGRGIEGQRGEGY